MFSIKNARLVSINKYIHILEKEKATRGGFPPVVGDLTDRLNVNSIAQVYGAFLPAQLL